MEKFARVVKTVTYVALEDFEEKNMFETLHIVSKFLGNWDKKIRALFRKIFSELSQMPSARPQESFAEHHFFYQRNYVFCLKRGSAAIFLSRVKKAIQVSQNSNARVYRKHLWELYFEKLFFFSIVRTLSRETWTFSGKILARLSKL